MPRISLSEWCLRWLLGSRGPCQNQMTTWMMTWIHVTYECSARNNERWWTKTNRARSVSATFSNSAQTYSRFMRSNTQGRRRPPGTRPSPFFVHSHLPNMYSGPPHPFTTRPVFFFIDNRFDPVFGLVKGVSPVSNRF